MRDFRNPRYKVLRDGKNASTATCAYANAPTRCTIATRKLAPCAPDSMKCVNCQRCTLLCPTRALAITHWPQVDAGSAVWTEGAMDDITAQAQTGGVLLASMGNPKSYHIYWEHLLLNASQVTNPSIDPLREPHGNPRGAGQPPEQAARERAHPHRRLSPAAPAVLRCAHHVLGHELRLGIA